MHAQRGAHAIANDVDRGAEAATTATQGLLTCWSVLWSTSGTRMRPHTRAVHDPVFHIWVLGTVCPQALPHAPVAPARTGVYTRFPVPYAAGRTRHCAPRRSSHRTASTKRRHARSSVPRYGGGSGRTHARHFVQCSSVRCTLVIRRPYQRLLKCHQNLVQSCNYWLTATTSPPVICTSSLGVIGNTACGVPAAAHS